MLGRTGGLLLIFVALLVGIVIHGALKPTSPDIPKQGLVPRASGYEPGGSACAGSGGGLTARERSECEKEGELYRLQFSDLVQQTRAANAAEAQAVLSFEVARMVLLGTIAGVFTLFAAIAAAVYARDAAEAAKAHLRHATKTSEDELRPWLQLEIEPGLFRLTDEHAFARYTLALTNLGGLPARGVFTDSRIFNSGSETADIKRYFETRLKAGQEGARTILPKGEVRLQRVARREREEVLVTETDGETQVHPILAVQAVYEWGDGRKGRTCQTYEILRQGGDLRPIPVNPNGETRRRFDVNHTMLDTIL